MGKVSDIFRQAKKRTVILLLAIIVIIAIFTGYYLSKKGESPIAGGASVPGVPGGVQFTPGQKGLSKEYLQRLKLSEEQKAQIARQRGQTSLPILIGGDTTKYAPPGTTTPVTSIPTTTQTTTTNTCIECCQQLGVYCKEKLPIGVVPQQTTSDLVDRMLGTGQISPDVASQLKSLSDGGASVSDYSAALDRLVKDAKLTPDQAKLLLTTYRVERGLPEKTANELVDQMLNAGQIPSDVASQLKGLSDRKASVSDYSAELDRLVNEGKLTPEQASELLAAYRIERGLPAKTANDLLDQLAASGQISPETASTLKKLSDQGASVNDYAIALGKLVKAGELKPDQSVNLLSAYRREHSLIKPTEVVTESAIDKLVEAGRLSAIDADMLKNLAKKRILPSEYASNLNDLVQAGKLSPTDAQNLLSAYIIKRGTKISSTGDKNMDQLKQSQEDDALQQQRQLLADAQAQEAEKMAEMRGKQQQEIAQKISALQSSISQQAQKLFTSWNVVEPVQTISVVDKTQKGAGGADDSSSAENKSGIGGAASQYPFIKAGTIMFAVLNTAVNSDHPAPVMGTIVSGKFKGAKIMGSLTRSDDRVILKFNMLTMNDWPETIAINAVAINPDTAQTAIASSVDHHYLLRYGAIFATSFIEGYSDAIMHTGTTAYNVFGITVTNPTLTPKERVMVGVGKIGQNLAAVTQKYINKPPTVRVNAGVGLGLLFTGDVRMKPYFNSAEEGDSAAQKATTPAATMPPAVSAATTAATAKIEEAATK